MMDVGDSVTLCRPLRFRISGMRLCMRMPRGSLGVVAQISHGAGHLVVQFRTGTSHVRIPCQTDWLTAAVDSACESMLAIALMEPWWFYVHGMLISDIEFPRRVPCVGALAR